MRATYRTHTRSQTTPLRPPKRRHGRWLHSGVVPPLSGPPSLPVGCKRPDCRARAPGRLMNSHDVANFPAAWRPLPSRGRLP
eukprot:4008532-Prymnesium_polylepis.1